jgi:hypothetical protein
MGRVAVRITLLFITHRFQYSQKLGNYGLLSKYRMYMHLARWTLWRTDEGDYLGNRKQLKVWVPRHNLSWDVIFLNKTNPERCRSVFPCCYKRPQSGEFQNYEFKLNTFRISKMYCSYLWHFLVSSFICFVYLPSNRGTISHKYAKEFINKNLLLLLLLLFYYIIICFV